MIEDKIIAKGDVERITQWKDGREEIYCFPNTVLKTGRTALVKSLTNNIY